MLSDVMNYFGLKRSFNQAGYFETPEISQLFKELKSVITQGQLIALSGMVGCGKTTALQRLISELATEKDIIISRSLALDKERVSLGTFMMALFYDLSTEKTLKFPTQAEQRERKLLALIQKCRKPVVLFVDEAHDLHHKTLVGLKRLIELVRYGNGTLSVVLAGHPKLKNDLRRPTLEEMGARTNVFTLEGIRGHQQDYIIWLLNECTMENFEINELITKEAIALLTERLTTPLQIKYYLELAMEEAYRIGQKPIEKDIVETVLAAEINDLEPRLVRSGYNTKALANLLNIKTSEVRSFLQGQLTAGRAQDLKEQMLKIGIPV